MTILLTKEKGTINLSKDNDAYGEVRINLTWDVGSKAKKGFLGLFKGSEAAGIDLDLGCLFELKDGSKGGVQALGKAFGDLNRAPFIALDGDDRTGESADGEWLRINGAHWADIKRVLVYTFIYDGVANWAATNGAVTVHAPNATPIEVKLDEGSNRLGMCAIATLVNDGGVMRVEREVKYFAGHQEMDRHYHFGLRWTQGSKD